MRYWSVFKTSETFHRMTSESYDAIVIGAGSAGFAAARTLQTAGWRVAILEGSNEIGGLCILRGCMPTKAILHGAELRQAIEEGRRWGIATGPISVDIARLMARKDELISDFAGYRRKQLTSGKFDFIQESGRFMDPHTVELAGGRRLAGKHFVIATGSTLAPAPRADLADVGYLTSDSALRLHRLPGSMIVLGGGPVALEFAQFFLRLGVAVTVVQRSAQVLRGTDADVARELEAALQHAGMRVFTGTELLAFERTEHGKRVSFRQGDNVIEMTVDEIFNGLGRIPATAQLGLERAGVETTPGGQVRVDLQQRSSQPHIIAAGDCCGPFEIVHVAIQQAELGAWNLLYPENPREMDYRLLVSVTFTDPQVATVGASETNLRERGIAFRSATYPFNDHGKSLILGSQHGFVKLIADSDSGEILGGACVGPQGGELIHEIVVAMSQRMTSAQLAAVPHYHPTLAEIWTYPAEDLSV